MWRRYSDFEWLHKRLSTVYPAAIIPIFPEKRMLNNTDEAFVSTRTAALAAYTDKVSRACANNVCMRVVCVFMVPL